MNRKCDHCDREATVHEVTVRNGVKIERHLCEECAHASGISIQPQKPIDELIKHFVVAQGLTPVVPPAAQPPRASACPTCKTTFAEFKQHGLLGCADCYRAFEGQLLPLLERAHEGGQTHVGKLPTRTMAEASDEMAREAAARMAEEREQRVRMIRSELDQAVKDERYEMAAKLRDRHHVARRRVVDLDDVAVNDGEVLPADRELHVADGADRERLEQLNVVAVQVHEPHLVGEAN